MSPQDGDTLAAIQAVLTVRFSEPVAARSVNDTSFILRNGGTLVPGSITVVGAEARYNPLNTLLYSTPYDASVSTAVTDTAGNRLSAEYAWSFRTQRDTTLWSLPPGYHIQAITADSSGNVLAAGFSPPGAPPYIARLDPQGTVRWLRQLADSSCQVTHLAVTAAGAVVVASWFGDPFLCSLGVAFTALYDFDSTGTQVWRTIVRSGSANGLALSPTGDIYLAWRGGSSQGFARLTPGGALADLDSLPDRVPLSFAFDQSNLYLSGFVALNAAPYFPRDVFITKYSLPLAQSWDRRFGDADSSEEGTFLAFATGNDRLYLAGRSSPANPFAGPYRTYLLILDTAGAVTTELAPGGVQAVSLQTDGQGSAYLATKEPGQVIKLRPDGTTVWSVPAPPFPRALNCAVPTYSIALSRTHVYLSNCSNRLNLFDLQSGRPVN